MHFTLQSVLVTLKHWLRVFKADGHAVWRLCGDKRTYINMGTTADHININVYK